MKNIKIKLIVIILAVVILLGAVVAINKGKKESPADVTTTENVQQDPTESSDGPEAGTEAADNGNTDNNTDGDSGNNNEEGIIQNGGDIEIIVPDAEETTGE